MIEIWVEKWDFCFYLIFSNFLPVASHTVSDTPLRFSQVGKCFSTAALGRTMRPSLLQSERVASLLKTGWQTKGVMLGVPSTGFALGSIAVMGLEGSSILREDALTPCTEP